MADGQFSTTKARKSTRTCWELNPNEVSAIEIIGAGSTSTVYSGIYRGARIAIKEINDVDDGTILAVRRELDVMTRTSHPHLLQFVGIISQEAPLRLCLEMCVGGTLFDLLHNRWDIELSWTQRLKILIDISDAMEYLHSFRKQIIHRDLKSLNIFLFDEMQDLTSVPIVKIADFGFARMKETVQNGIAPMRDWPTLTRGAGSPHWMAPEIYAGNHYDVKADTFSFAIVMYEVSTRHMAFEELEPCMAAGEIQSGARPDVSKPDPMPADTPDQLMELIEECWRQDSSLRPGFPEIHARLKVIGMYYGC